MSIASQDQLRPQHAAVTTPRKMSPSMVDFVDQTHESKPHFFPESTYPTPPESSPRQDYDHVDSVPISKPAPLVLNYRATEPRTPKNRVNVGRYDQYTPFHDIKQDIDNLIGELPENLEANNHVLVEQQQITNGTHLSLYLYSPCKKQLKAAAQEYIDKQDSNEEEVDGHELLILPYTDLPVEQQVLRASPSLLRKAGRMLKRTIMLFIPRNSNGVSTLAGLRRTTLPLNVEPTKSRKEFPREMSLDEQKALKSRQRINSVDTSQQSDLSKPICSARKCSNISRNLSFPVITAKTPVPERRTRHVTRKPLPEASFYMPRVKEVRVGSVQPPHSPLRTHSQHAPVYNTVAGHHNVALVGAPIEVKAAASLCVMALAAAADFLAEDECMQRTPWNRNWRALTRRIVRRSKVRVRRRSRAESD